MHLVMNQAINNIKILLTREILIFQNSHSDMMGMSDVVNSCEQMSPLLMGDRGRE
jgi:hypothetical protein